TIVRDARRSAFAVSCTPTLVLPLTSTYLQPRRDFIRSKAMSFRAAEQPGAARVSRGDPAGMIRITICSTYGNPDHPGRGPRGGGDEAGHRRNLGGMEIRGEI